MGAADAVSYLRLPLNRYCANGPCAFFKRIPVKDEQAFVSMFAIGATSWTQPLQPSKHSSHKHNWNFIERKTTGWKFFLGTTVKSLRVSKPCRRYTITGSSLFYTGTKSVQTDPQKRLSHARLCTLRPTASPRGCLKVWVQWEKTTGEAVQ